MQGWKWLGEEEQGAWILAQAGRQTPWGGSAWRLLSDGNLKQISPVLHSVLVLQD
jgi:hypothetical protein